MAVSTPNVAADLSRSETYDLTVADAVWIATALLHNKYPSKDLSPQNSDSSGFTTDQILQKVTELKLTDKATNTVRQHIVQHCVANRPPQPNRSCQLFALGKGYRRLFRRGDKFEDGRIEARNKPDSLPAKFEYLSAWYDDWCKRHNAKPSEDPLISAIGIGKHVWGTQDAVDYVAELRQGWEEDER